MQHRSPIGLDEVPDFVESALFPPILLFLKGTHGFFY